MIYLNKRCDTFLWGYLKDNVYKNNPQTKADLKKEIIDKINSIDKITLKKVMSNFEARLRHLLINNGNHFENIIHF